MIERWADHCSSDEEDDEASASLPVDREAIPVSPDDIVPTGTTMAGAAATPKERVYDFPTQPPFTAYIGNLSYQIKDDSMLVEAVWDLAKEKLQESINIIGGRVAYFRNDHNGKHRGFGYVEVETLEQVS
jgi:hypothetical protein